MRLIVRVRVSWQSRDLGQSLCLMLFQLNHAFHCSENITKTVILLISSLYVCMANIINN